MAVSFLSSSVAASTVRHGRRMIDAAIGAIGGGPVLHMSSPEAPHVPYRCRGLNGWTADEL